MAEQHIRTVTQNSEFGNSETIDITTDGSGTVQVNGYTLEATEEAHVYNITGTGKPVPVHLQFDGISKVIVSVRGYSYQVSVHFESHAELLKVLAASPALKNKYHRILSPMPGLLKHIVVNQGDAVKKGASLFVLEAMKMENAIKSPTAGIVSNISVNEGEAYEKGTLLCEIQPS